MRGPGGLQPPGPRHTPHRTGVVGQTPFTPVPTHDAHPPRLPPPPRRRRGSLPRSAVSLWAEASPVPRDPATGDARVPLVLSNDGATTRYVPACGAQPTVMVERRRIGGWDPYGSGTCIAVLPMVPIELKPGAERRFTCTISEPGEYRMQAESYAAADGREPRPVAGIVFWVE